MTKLKLSTIAVVGFAACSPATTTPPRLHPCAPPAFTGETERIYYEMDIGYFFSDDEPEHSMCRDDLGRDVVAARPIITRTTALEYTSLPLLGDDVAAQAGEGAFDVVAREGLQTIAQDHDLVIVNAHVASGDSVGCDFPLAPADVVWEGYLTRTRTKEALEVRRYFGVIDATCRGTAVRVSGAQARALAPNIAYAYRRCLNGCTEPLDSPERSEELVVIGPPPAWAVGTTKAPDFEPIARAKMRTTLPIRRGTSAALALSFLPADIRAFERGQVATITERQGSHVEITLNVDVVWLDSEPEPSLLASIGWRTVAAANVSAFTPPPRYEEQYADF